MAINNLYQIYTYDDGNIQYASYPNEWEIIDTMFDGGKVKLRNRINTEIVVNSISSWKIIKR